MLLLVTGASGVGKTTVRKLLEAQLEPEVECVELGSIALEHGVRGLAWRQQATEIAVERAVQLELEGRHLLLCGDPVAAVEVVAVPSASRLSAIAACLLDADPETQAARLAARGDDPDLLVHHHAFADWMRRQATDPEYMLEVVTSSGWPEMRWDHIPLLAAQWHVHTIETTDLSPAAVKDAALAWVRGTLAGDPPAIRLDSLRS